MGEHPRPVAVGKSRRRAQEPVAQRGRAGLHHQAVHRARAAGARAQSGREASALREAARRRSPIGLAAQNKHLGELFEQAPGFMVVLRGPDHVFELANAAYFSWSAHRDMIGRPIAEALPEVREQGFIELAGQGAADR